MKQSNKPYQNEKLYLTNDWRRFYNCRHHSSNQDICWLNLNLINCNSYRKSMKVIKAQFKDEAGYYTMTWSFNPTLWEVKDIIQNECKKSKATFIKFISYDKK
jgi:hypothetical protein